MQPNEIEALSFQIIDEEAGTHQFDHSQWQIVRRMIHTSADFEYIKTIRFHPDAIQAGLNAIIAGKPVITDTNMARIGIRHEDLKKYGSVTHCLIAEPKVKELAEKKAITRAKVAVDCALDIIEGGIYVVGNAPTALLRLLELIQSENAKPALVVGLPVGFVNAVESKAALLKTDIPYITNVGRKGGSNVAASVINALIVLAQDIELSKSVRKYNGKSA
jgi:precorrin-8X/cobalt-precorrin-8 methylmutase